MANISRSMRVLHRYLGFFLAGIMAVYAISGIVLIFRDTDFLRSERLIQKTIKPNLPKEELGKTLHIKGFKVLKEEKGVIHFRQGTYTKNTGVTSYTAKKLPYILDRMAHLHIATSSRPLFFLNIFFGVALLFFVISAFWMFLPSSSIFKKSLYFTLAGIIFTLVMLFI